MYYILVLDFITREDDSMCPHDYSKININGLYENFIFNNIYTYFCCN